MKDKQTAVEWFFAQVHHVLHGKMAKVDIDKVLEQAEQIEKEQIKSAYINGGVRATTLSSEDYYDKMYKNKSV